MSFLDSMQISASGLTAQRLRLDIISSNLANVDTTPGCQVWGTSRKLSAPHAALVNGTMIQSFELDDVHRAGVLHVGAVTLQTSDDLTSDGHGVLPPFRAVYR